MRTKNFLKHLMLGALLLSAGKVAGQSTTPGNVAGGVLDFLGWNNTFPANNFPLMIRHDLNQPIDFYTNANYKLRLYPNVVGNIPNAQGGTDAVNQDGFLVISPEQAYYGAGNYGPFTRLHLADLNDGSTNAYHYNQPWGFRTWMRNGVTFTGNHDQLFIGCSRPGALDREHRQRQAAARAGGCPAGGRHLHLRMEHHRSGQRRVQRDAAG